MNIHEYQAQELVSYSRNRYNEPKDVGPMHDLFIFRSRNKSIFQRWSLIAGVLITAGLSWGIVSCKPAANEPAPETQETSAADASPAKAAQDFGPALLRIGERWELDGARIVPAGKHGFIDTDGHVVMKPQWDDVTRYDGGFDEGVAPVKQKGKWGLIDKSGRFLSEPQWENKGELSFYEGFAGVKRNGKWGFIDRTGRVVIEPKFDAVGYPGDGLFPFKQNGKWGFCDTTGRVVSEPQWELEFPGGEDLAPLTEVDPSSDPSVPGDDIPYPGFRDGLAAVQKNLKWGYIDKTGRVVTKVEWDGAECYGDGMGLIVLNKKFGFVDPNGRLLVKPTWDSAWHFRNGFGRVKRNGKWGLIDKTGREVIAPVWDEMEDFMEGLVAAKRAGKWSYLDKTGRTVLETQWDQTWGFSAGVAVVEQAGKRGAIDHSGHVVIEPQWDRISLWFNKAGLAIVHNRARDGVIDKTGRVIIEPAWDAIQDYQEGEGAPFYFLAGRIEYKREFPPASSTENLFGKKTVVAAWFDSKGRQIWSSASSAQP
jgi:hypothetical protein